MFNKIRPRPFRKYPKTNIIVLSESSKVIFHRYGDEGSISSVCAVLQTLRVTTRHDERLGFGDIRRISTRTSKIVFKNAGHLVFVAIAYRDSHDGEDSIETDDYLQLQLEYVYSSILFTLTEEVQDMAQNDLDIKFMLGSCSEKIRNLLDEMELPWTTDHSYFLGGVNILSPIPGRIRDHSSKILAMECSKSPSIIYAMLSIKKQLITIVQPRDSMYQLTSHDLNLLLEFLDGQINEAWFPLCLPRLSTNGFVHGYQNNLSGTSDLKLTLISQEPSTEEFSMLRSVADKIRHLLGFKSQPEENILQIYHLNDKYLKGDDALLWERIHLDDNEIIHDDDSHHKALFNRSFLNSIKIARDHILQEKKMKEYCDMSLMQHFIFRYNMPIRDFKTGSVVGCLPQCFGPSFEQTLDGSESASKYWKMYQRMSLIPRIDSSPIEGDLDGFVNWNSSTKQNAQESFELCRLSQTLHEKISDMSDTSLYYKEDKEEAYVIYWNKDFEFYGIMNGTMTSRDNALILCSTLVETLLHKKGDIFISVPLAFL
jgi:hypothetical protein